MGVVSAIARHPCLAMPAPASAYPTDIPPERAPKQVFLDVGDAAVVALDDATGVTTAATAMVCGPASDGRNPWHAA